jgi:type III secretion system chaperone SycN
MTFSNQALQAIEAFAANMGLSAQPAPDGSYSFVFERSGTLTLTSATDGERTLVSLRGTPGRIDEEIESRLLALAGPDVTTGRFLSTGLMRDGAALFAVGIDDREMDLPVMEVCIQQLMAARAAAG